MSKEAPGIWEQVEDKFIVIKKEDTLLLPTSYQIALDQILHQIKVFRRAEDKNPDNTYLVVNTDEDYAGHVLLEMRKHGHCKEEYSLEGRNDLLECSGPPEQCIFPCLECFQCPLSLPEGTLPKVEE